MAKIVRDYLDPSQIGQIVEISVYVDDEKFNYGAGRLVGYARYKSAYTIFFEGVGVAMYWTDNCEFTVSYDPERIR